MGRDMIGFVAFDFVLGIVFRRMMRMAFVVEVSGVDRNDGPRHTTGLGIPAYMVADLESPSHRATPLFLRNNAFAVVSLRQHRSNRVSRVEV
jgi:hypothetical protein